MREILRHDRLPLLIPCYKYLPGLALSLLRHFLDWLFAPPTMGGFPSKPATPPKISNPTFIPEGSNVAPQAHRHLRRGR